MICLLVVLMRGQQQSSSVQRHPVDAQPQQNPFSVREQEQEAHHGTQQSTAEAMRGVQPPKKQAAAAAKPIQQQAVEQQPVAAAGQPDDQQQKTGATAKQQGAAGSSSEAATGPGAQSAEQQAEQPKQAQQEQQPKQQPKQEPQQQALAAQQQDGGGQGGSAGGESSGSDGGSEEDGPSGGWSDSFLKTKADAQLGNLLDLTSLMSPLRTCAADGFSLEVQETEAEDLLADEIEGRPALSEAQLRWKQFVSPQHTLVTGTAHNLPCGARRNGGTCCSHPVTFRRNTTDYRVFKQVFQCHYMRYLYTLFGDQPPKYILDAGANAGFSTILFKLLWPEATVVMLEPDPSNFAILSRNVATLKDVHPINAGLWGRTANITAKASHGNWGKVFQEAEEGQPGMPAYSVTDVARQAGVPAFDFVKIDIEGAEGQVFAPGRDVSWIKQARAVSLELHDFFSGYFGLRRGEISERVDAAFSSTGFTPVSDNEHIIYLNPELQAAVSQLRAPIPKLIAIRQARLKKITGC
ncbi:hypothetical protein COHA_007155 [Chlorella ohadii]|uniref:Methyltransferase FkbM domain-containing protein n=1 Tax=Chlorella ohadii TaxID=2649997 RepID=A0AAD5H4K8_9CHLO|nr:hypothetical protein COHA_007155 [Chlorella ohadii]